MAKTMTTTSYALLGLLGLQPWSTYELAKQVERSLGWFWPRTERKIYDEAKWLVEAGFASARIERSGGRRRTVYDITAAGERALAEWLGEPSAATKLESEAQVRVFFADGGDLSQLRSTLHGIADEARAKLALLHDLIAAADDQAYPFARRLHINAISIRFQMDHQRTTAQWADWAQRAVDQWRDVDDPGDWDWRAEIATS